MSERKLGDVYKSEHGYEIHGLEWASGWPLQYGLESNAKEGSRKLQKGLKSLLDSETAKLQADNAALREEVARLREFVGNVADWVANPEERRKRQRDELDALLLALHREAAEELKATWETSEE